MKTRRIRKASWTALALAAIAAWAWKGSADTLSKPEDSAASVPSASPDSDYSLDECLVRTAACAELASGDYTLEGRLGVIFQAPSAPPPSAAAEVWTVYE